MSALLAAGCARSSFHGVSVVPMIQWSPHGITNSTLVVVRRIRPAGEMSGAVDRRARHHQVHALGRAHPEARRGGPRASRRCRRSTRRWRR